MRKNKYNKEQSYQGAVNMLKRIESHYDGYFSRSDFNPSGFFSFSKRSDHVSLE